MKKILCWILCLSVALPFCVAQNRVGFYTQGRFLYDKCGEKVVLRGVNEMSVWAGADPTGAIYMPEIKKTGANGVRIAWLTTANVNTLDQIIQNAINNQLIPIVELHDATGNWSGLNNLVNFWVRADIVALIKKHEQYLIVNIGNEVGNETITDAMFIQGYNSAVSRMRTAGINTALMIDAPEWGKNIDILTRTAPTILNADPNKNLIFSVHPYWPKNNGANAAYITGKLQAAVNANYCLVIGELSAYGAWAGQGVSVCSNAGAVDYQTFLVECNKHEIGWLAWSWGMASNTGGGDPTCSIMDMATNGRFANLKAGWAMELATTSPYSIKNTSKTSNFIKTRSCGTPPPPPPTGSTLPSNLTSCGKAFFQSLINLTNGVGVQQCAENELYKNAYVSGKMDGACYGGGHGDGVASYVLYKYANPIINETDYSKEFRAIWSANPAFYGYYGACAPSDLQYTLPEVTENHIFGAMLVQVAKYKAYTGEKSYDNLKTIALPHNTIAKINAIKFEGTGGYINQTEANNYANKYSCKGFVVTATLKNGTNVNCYLVNNYDTGGTILWKQ